MQNDPMAVEARDSSVSMDKVFGVPSTVLPSFKGSDEWIHAQREKKRLKLAKRELAKKSTIPIVAFNRGEFTAQVRVRRSNQKPIVY